MSMKTRVFLLALLAQILAGITSFPLLFIAGISAWGDQCGHDGYTSCQSSTMIIYFVFFAVIILLTVVIGRFLLKRFAGCLQPLIKTLIVIGVIDALLAVAPSSGYSSSSIFILLVYPLYTLYDYTSSIQKQNK
jgi:hypothetical protein